MSVGNISTATKIDFQALHRKMSFSGCTEDEFVDDCEKQQEIALLDAKTLEPFNASPEKLGKKIHEIVDGLGLLYQKNGTASRQVKVDGVEFRVFVTSTGNGIEGCNLCHSRVHKQLFYKIINSTTMKDVVVSESTIHLIEKHGHFGIPSTSGKITYRVDPSLLCHVLGYA